jgi:transcriptional regulator with XRE-family HTH domain
MDMQTLSAVATEVLATLGETIKAARLRREWSVRNVAERVGVSPTTISKIERGDPSVAVGTIIETARIVGIDLYGGNVRGARSANAELLSLLPQRGRSKRIANNDF